jgi:hypothetical protein
MWRGVCTEDGTKGVKKRISYPELGIVLEVLCVERERGLLSLSTRVGLGEIINLPAPSP